VKNKTILLISTEAWGTNFVSKHHYANYLAKNNNVYFLNPVLSSKINPFGKTNVEVKQIKENLVQVNYQNLLPKLNRLPKLIQQYVFKQQAKQIQIYLGINKFDIVWSFDPYRFWNQRVWNADKKVYHTVDFHPKSRTEMDIINSSTLALSISSHIPSKKITKQHNIKIINHGFHNANLTRVDTNIPGKNKLKAVYVGNVANLLDKNRLNQLAVNHADIDFILIGPNSNSNLSIVNKENNSSFTNNVFCLGEIKANLIDSYLKNCNINLLLLKDRLGIKNINSHKLMHYFNSGNVTISDYLLDYEKKNILDMAKTTKEFENLFNKTVANLEYYNSEKLKKERKKYALDNSYVNKIEEITKLLYNT